MIKASQSTKRSDQVRQRRSQAGQQRVQRAAQTATRPAAAVPPVVSRSPMAGVAQRQKPRAKPRRQIYYSLSTPGAEVRLPALPAVHPGWRLLSGALTAGLLALVFMLWNLPMFQLEAARLSGAQRLTAHDINAVLDVSGLRSFEVSAQEMEDELRTAFPELSAVSVRVGFPASLLVTVKERTPLLAWNQDGGTQWIDAAGIAFPARGDAPEGLVAVDGQAPPAPVAPAEAGADPAAAAAAVAAKEPQPFISPALIPSILAMRAEAPAGVDLVYDPRYGLGWDDPKGWKVYFGLNNEDMSLKLQEYQAIVARLEAEGIQPKLISVEFIHAPFYRLEP